MKTKFLTLLLILPFLAACSGLNGNVTSGDYYHYSYEIGFINGITGEHAAVSSLVVSGTGSHKGTPGIYIDGQTVLPFVDRGPCAEGSPCWKGKVTVPVDGKHEFTIMATVKTTPAEWNHLKYASDDLEQVTSYSLYCEVSLEGKIVSLLAGTGVGYAVTPVQDSAEHSVKCSAHN